MKQPIVKTYTTTGRVKAGYNPAGLSSKSHKSTPGSAGTNAHGVVLKKRASLLIRKVLNNG